VDSVCSRAYGSGIHAVVGWILIAKTPGATQFPIGKASVPPRQCFIITPTLIHGED
jgi:hypothetical protein